jgi:tetratricopeptide (TPR) repeat protein
MKQAEDLYRKALAIGRQEDPNGFWQAFPLFGLAILIAPRDPAGAAELSRQRYELFVSHRGLDEPNTAIAKILWARQRSDAGELGEAASQVLEAVKIVRKRFLPSSMNLWFALNNSAHVLVLAKRYHEAESLAREALPIFDANHIPDNDGRRAESLFELGKALRGEKKNREAAEVLNKSAEIYDASGRKFWAQQVRDVLNQR